MGDQTVEPKEGIPPTDVQQSVQPPVGASVDDGKPVSAPVGRIAHMENPLTKRRVSSIEVVKGAPPPKRQSSVVVFETPDIPKKEEFKSKSTHDL
ncbi:unnamed protein product [Angiostrongylus costaricensis]|uniref:PEST proteolytic signal-containing nuclear protein n=1 Tax=Angiostrongylus costaricensis TaxID=334426 RepID=A0A0R3PQ08_ANGCS|nr:unnamed protein product [Angiostrongylus costaricensis]